MGAITNLNRMGGRRYPVASLPSASWSDCFRKSLFVMIVINCMIMFFMAFFIIPSTLDEQDLKNNVHSLIAAAKQVVIDHTQTQTGGSSSSNGQSTSKRYHNNNSNNDNMEAYVEQHGAIVINLASQQRRRSSLPVYDEKKWDESIEAVTKILSLDYHSTNIKSCQSYSQDGGILIHERCQQHLFHHGVVNDSDHKESSIALYAYNPLNIPRYWCEYEIKPLSAIEVVTNGSLECDEPVRIFSMNHNSPPVSGNGMQPIIFRRDDAVDSKLDDVQCDIPCQFTMDNCKINEGSKTCLPPNLSAWKVDGTPFQFLVSDNPPSQRDGTSTDRQAFRQHRYFSTRSLESEIPLSAFDWNDPVFKSTNPLSVSSMDQVFPKIVFVKTKQECDQGPVKAVAWAKSIQTTFGTDKFDSFGSCFNTETPPSGFEDVETNRENRIKLFGKYMFTLVPERSLDSDYVSELLWDALWSGSIPVHVGAQNVEDHVPQNSVIAAGNLFGGNKDKLGEYLKQVANDPTLWSKYHVWRDKSSEEWKEWREKYMFLETSPYCRMCRWAHAKRYGLSWDHVKQKLHSKPTTVLDRRACVAKNNLVGGNSMKEIWLTNSDYVGARGKNQHCDLSNPSTNTIDFNTHVITRTVVSHDNVLDFNIHSTESKSESGELVLRLEIGKLRNTDGAHFPHVHKLLNLDNVVAASAAAQDSDSKVTVLANWPTKIYCREGQIDVLVQVDGDDRVLPDETRRIRVMYENLDPLRDKRTEYNFSPFASNSARDFFNPLEFYFSEVSRR